LKGAHHEDLFLEYLTAALEEQLVKEGDTEDKEAVEAEGEANGLELDGNCNLDVEGDNDFQQLG
jgi:hypothetical protein